MCEGNDDILCMHACLAFYLISSKKEGNTIKCSFSHSLFNLYVRIGLLTCGDLISVAVKVEVMRSHHKECFCSTEALGR